MTSVVVEGQEGQEVIEEVEVQLKEEGQEV